MAVLFSLPHIACHVRPKRVWVLFTKVTSASTLLDQHEPLGGTSHLMQMKVVLI